MGAVALLGDAHTATHRKYSRVMETLSGEASLRNDDPQVRKADRYIALCDGLYAILGSLRNIDSKHDDVWVAQSILRSSRRAYLHMCNGWRSDSTYVGWACRNLIELRFFANYVVKSPENRRRFIDDLSIDSEQSNDALAGLIKAHQPGSETKDRELGKLRDLDNIVRRGTSFQGKKYLVPTQLEVDFPTNGLLAVHKLCSKLVHPTAQSILISESQHERDGLFLCGASCFITLVDELVAFVKTLEG